MIINRGVWQTSIGEIIDTGRGFVLDGKMLMFKLDHTGLKKNIFYDGVRSISVINNVMVISKDDLVAYMIPTSDNSYLPLHIMNMKKNDSMVSVLTQDNEIASVRISHKQAGFVIIDTVNKTKNVYNIGINYSGFNKNNAPLIKNDSVKIIKEDGHQTKTVKFDVLVKNNKSDSVVYNMAITDGKYVEILNDETEE